MGIVLTRLDERLIHGQVVLGWGSQLRPEQYLVVDDELAASDWEQELYRLGAGDTAVVFATVAEARGRLAEWRASPSRSVLLVRDVGTLRRLGAGGLYDGQPINLGGLHHGSGRRQVLPYLHLSADDLAELASLESEGAQVWAQDLPDAPRVPLRSLQDG
ncbi:MAG: PTS system mannose/fructose/N-acetylgalactosamine-transporter subunit IIB [Longimicrobiales bacterium]